MSFSLRRALSAALFFSFSALISLPAAHAASFDATQRKEIGEIVRDYLINNPEVLQEMVAELEKRQQEVSTKDQAEALKAPELFNSNHSSVVGNEKGTATIVEFFDYNCGYCKHALQVISEMIKADPNLKVVLKDLPVLGPESQEASKVALAVKQQLQGTKLFDYHSRLLSTKGRIGREQALAVARDMGVNMDQLKKDMASPDITAALKENMILAGKLGVNGTPGFVIGDTVIPGAVGRDLLEEKVANVRKCGKGSC